MTHHQKRIDMIGRKFGRLTVLYCRPKYCDVQCICGIAGTVQTHKLKIGTTRSCGCLRRETSTRNGKANRKVWTEDFDWRLPNIALAKLFKISRERVRQLRKAAGVAKVNGRVWRKKRA